MAGNNINITTTSVDTSRVNFTSFEAQDLTNEQQNRVKTNQFYAVKLAEAYEQAASNASQNGRDVVSPTDLVWLPAGLDANLVAALDPDGDGLVSLELLQQGFAERGFEPTKAAGSIRVDQLTSVDSLSDKVVLLLAYSAQQQSLLPRNQGGGIVVENGQFYFGGIPTTNRTVYFGVRLNQIDNIEKAITRRLAEINESNELVRIANQFLEVLRAARPSDSADEIDIGDNVRSAFLGQNADGSNRTWSEYVVSFQDEHGIDPFAEFTTYTSFSKLIGRDSPDQSIPIKRLTYNEWDAIIEAGRARIGAVNSENQIKQVALTRLNNQRGDVTDGISSNTQSNAQTEAGIAQNF